MNCRHCKKRLDEKFLDLGFSPPSNAYLIEDALKSPEVYYPLQVHICQNCWLAQTCDATHANNLFTDDYAYLSSTSLSWLDHAKVFSEKIIDLLDLNASSFVVEIASNDGYLLKNFVDKKIPCLGIEPTESTSVIAEERGVKTIKKFFGGALAQELVDDNFAADLIVGNNVFAHVPDINDFTDGMRILLKLNGTITLEFPHILRLLEFSQFDTVYHEHFSYLSLTVVNAVFSKFSLKLIEVEELSTHGGSLRVYGCHKADPRKVSVNVQEILEAESSFGLLDLHIYRSFQSKVDVIKNNFLKFIIREAESGKLIAGYGAAAKGNTLLNYAGVKSDLISFICDGATSKQGKLMPGSHIPILHPSELRRRKPDIIVIFPWNICEEIFESNKYVQEWGGKFFTVIPAVKEIN